MAKLEFELHPHALATITLTGEIVPGEAIRFQQLVEQISDRYGAPEEPIEITAALDSPGGDYSEGLLLGDLFWRNGYATLVRKDAECYFAAALAFLGGARLGVVGGWGASRTLQVGGRIGFHGFYSDSLERISLSEGVEQGKMLSILVMSYATALRVDMDFISERLEKGPAELLILRTIGQFRKLGIAIVGTKRTEVLTDEGATNVANYATEWKRPVSLRPRAGETLAHVRHLTARRVSTRGGAQTDGI